ncbi:MAG: MgtC/SapB family protein [Lachnospiraceae bacterium]|nr:MgtC/SapB family protein [Lachnospiraceae bacterium]
MKDFLVPEYFRELNMLSILLRFLICIICGGMIGIEREWKHRTAGLKTHILVCLGSAVCMMTGQYVWVYFASAGIDPTRIGAQVISGIGFLGVGTIIIKNNTQVKGLTTAAGLWVSACIGLAAGIGFFEIAVIGTLCVELLFLVVRQLKVFEVVREYTIHLYVEVEDVTNIKELLKIIRNQECNIYSMNICQSINSKEGVVGVVLGIHGGEHIGEELTEVVSQLDYVTGFEEME